MELKLTMKKEEFKILSDAEHVRIRPDTYIGSTTLEVKNLLINNEYKDVAFVPGLFKIINEVIDNSVDEFIKTDGKYANKIQINISDTNFEVIDNGRGIPVDYIIDDRGEKIYRPVAAWTRARAGSNFDDTNRETAGKNGIGGACNFFFSKYFEGTTADGKKQLVVKGKDAVIQSVKASQSTKQFTRVYSEPDFSMFGIDKFDDTFKELVKDRIENISLAYPKIEFKFNGQKCSRTLKQFSQNFPEAIIHSDKTTLLAIMPSKSMDFKFHAVTNGLINYNGGSHIEYVMNQIIPLLREKIKTKYKYDLTPAKLKTYLQVILVINGFKNPKFDTQTKERLTNTQAEVAAHLSHINYEDFAKKIMRSEAIINPIIEAQKLRLLDEDEEFAKKKAKELRSKKVASHIAATSKYPDKKFLYIVEGLGAASPFIEARNPEFQGVLPLQGKILNVTEKKVKDILENKSISNMMNVIGLEWGKKVTNLNYGTIVLMTDADMDGYSIQGLLINFLYKWPELFEQGRVKLIDTPKYILRGKKDRKYFYTDEEWKNYNGTMQGYELAYIKGLGSLEIDEYCDILKNPRLKTIIIEDSSFLDLMYGPEVSLRKTFMMN